MTASPAASIVVLATRERGPASDDGRVHGLARILANQDLSAIPDPTPRVHVVVAGKTLTAIAAPVRCDGQRGRGIQVRSPMRA